MNIFKKTISSIQSKSIDETIEQIHREFNTEGEILLAEAKKILSNQIDTDKGDRLAKLGFSKTKEATEAKNQKDKLAISEKLAKTIEYFQLHYPNKFIDEYGVKRICEKYGLICGDVGQYIGTVPDKNLIEIENFKLREEDVIYEMTFRVWGGLSEIIVEELTKEQYYSFYEWRQNGIYDFKNRRKNTDSLIICAPPKDFELTDRQKIDGYKIIDIPDPVVLQRVRGGYLIVSAWGIEASDNQVINPKNN